MKKIYYADIELSRKLKEKGYDEITEWIYDSNGKPTKTLFRSNSKLDDNECSRPTLMEIIDWLIINHNLFVEVTYLCDNYWSYIILTVNGNEQAGLNGFYSKDYDTYFEALNDGIKECMEIL